MRTCETCGNVDERGDVLVHCDMYDEWVDKDDCCPHHDDNPDWKESD